jgi:hypothetical protein
MHGGDTLGREVVVIDHIVMLVPDVEEAVTALRSRFGLGSESGPYHQFAGTRSRMVPLQPPTYLELLTIEDREAARVTEAGRRVLACEAAGFGFLGWAVRVDDLDEVSRRLGIPVFDHTIPRDDGTLRGWRSVTGPAHLPYFIDYPNNGDRIGRWRAMYERAGHTSSPGDVLELTVGLSEDELTGWLGPNSLPIRFAAGDVGIQRVEIQAAPRSIVLDWPL